MAPKKTLLDLETIINSLDTHQNTPDSMNGISYDKTLNNTLGFGHSPASYHVSIPYTSWPSGDKTTWPAPSVSALEEAFKDVLVGGASALSHGSDNKPSANLSGNFIIDIAHMAGGLGNFFTEKSPTNSKHPNQSVADVIASIVNGLTDCHNVKPVVRILIGILGTEKVGNLSPEDHDATAKTVLNIFWPEGGHQLITNPNAELHLGFYGPNFKPEQTTQRPSFEKPAEAAAKWLQGLIGSWVLLLTVGGSSDAANLLRTEMEKYDAKYIVNTLLKEGFRPVSWNHGKIVAVNGTHMMTGGANFWSEYERSGFDIFDMQAKIQGGVAVSAHKYCDYFWEYLQSGHGTDGRSHIRMSKLSQKGWAPIGPVPMFFNKKTTPPTPTAVSAVLTQGTVPVLSIAKLGDWHGKMTPIRFPVQMIDALRDLAMNTVWHIAHHLTDKAVSDKAVKALSIFMGQLKDTSLLDTFSKMDIHPAAWASRHVRVEAITRATKSVKMSVEHFAYSDLQGKTEWDAIVTDTNARVASLNKIDPNQLPDNLKWDGILWPYDLFFAFAECVKRGVTVQAILTTARSGSHNGYHDKTKLDQYKNRLVQVLVAQGVTQEKAKEYVVAHFMPVRIMGDTGTVTYNHAKVVCIDDELLYIGSENAYPSYNEEHGVWIDNTTAIDAWRTGYWEPLWKVSQNTSAN